MLLHHPLLPLKSTPPTNAAPITQSRSTAVAVPLVLKTASRAPAMPKKSAIASRKPRSCSHRGGVRPSVKPRTRADWLAEDSGQMLRQTPGATKNSTGSSGITMPKKIRSPVCGQTTSTAARDR